MASEKDKQMLREIEEMEKKLVELDETLAHKKAENRQIKIILDSCVTKRKMLEKTINEIGMENGRAVEARLESDNKFDEIIAQCQVVQDQFKAAEAANLVHLTNEQKAEEEELLRQIAKAEKEREESRAALRDRIRQKEEIFEATIKAKEVNAKLAQDLAKIQSGSPNSSLASVSTQPAPSVPLQPSPEREDILWQRIQEDDQKSFADRFFSDRYHSDSE